MLLKTFDTKDHSLHSDIKTEKKDPKSCKVKKIML